MQGLIFEDSTIGIFLLVTIFLGGGAAWMSGRAIARSWQTRLRLVIYLLILTFGVRFLHFALFGGHLFTVHFYLVDGLALLIFGLLGFQYQRTEQMTRQYRWIFEKTSPFTWRKRDNAHSVN